MIEYTTTTIPITLDTLPEGVKYEADGSAWRAVAWQGEPNGWRWQPLNWKAFAKEAPEGEMSDLAPDELEALGRLQASQALAELKRRHPEWDNDPACPDCGSREHFECDR